MDAPDRGGGLGRQQSVVGGLGGQFLDGRQPQVDRGGGQRPALEVQAIALHGRFREPGGGGVALIPGKELLQGLPVGAAGMLAREAVEDQGHQRGKRASRSRQGAQQRLGFAHGRTISENWI